MGFEAKIGVCFRLARCFASFQIALLQVILSPKDGGISSLQGIVSKLPLPLLRSEIFTQKEQAMKHEVKVTFYLKRNEEKEDGTCPVMARLTVANSEVVFSAKMSVPADLWASGRAAGKSKTATEINRKLDELRASVLSHHRELSAVKENVTAEEVKNLILGMASGQETLLAYFRANNEKFDKRVGVNRSKGSAKVYWNALNHVTWFVSEKYHLSDIPFSALDRSFIDKYDLYLRTERKLSQGMIVLLTIRLGTIINHAIAEGIITANPFAGYERMRPAPKQKYLPRKELDKLMSTPLTSPTHYVIRDMFLFSCFTGVSYCDMCRLTDDNLWTAEDGTVWIKSKRGKTGVDYQVPLLDLPLQILEQYRDTATDGRLLPMYSNPAMNRALKTIAETCGIFRRVSFHVARHTYASEITLSQGIPIETVSRMLGHSEIKTTQIYAKITDDKIDEDMRRLEERINGKFKFAI
jgi:integrase